MPSPRLCARRLLLGAGGVCLAAGLALQPLIAQDGPTLPGGEAPKKTAQADMMGLDLGLDDDDEAADDETPAVGLALVLPEDAPESIRPRAWDDLPDSWDDWAEETANRVADLYSGELDLKEQRYALKRLNVKLGTLRKAINDPTYSRIRGQLVEFEDALALRVALAEAALPAAISPPSGGQDAAIAREFTGLLNQVTRTRNDLNRVRHAELWKRYFRLTELANIALRRDDSDDALDQLDAVLAKLDGENADDEQEEFLERESLQDLAETIDELLAYLEEPPSDAEAFGEQLGEVFRAVDEYEQAVSRDAALDIKRLIGELPGRYTNGSRLAGILSQRYRGENVRGLVGEQLVRELLQQSDFERGVINDCILGARVVGSQLVNSNLSVDLLPSPTNLRFQLNLSGTVNTRTTGYKSPATIQSVGNHQYASNKTVFFDGYRFSSTPAAVGVNVNNRTIGVSTSIRFPIFRRIARNIARRRVAESAPQAAAITRRKVTESVGTRFNSEVDELLGQAESRVQTKLYQPLAILGLSPARQRIYSTDTTANLTWLVADADELSASEPPPLPMVSRGVSAQIHESYLNAFIDRLDLAGRTFSNAELRAHVSGRLSSAFGRPISFGGSNPSADANSDVSNAKFVFDTEDPVRVRVENERIVLRLRTGLELEDKDDIPTQIVEVPLFVSRRGSQIVVKQGDVSVEPAEGGGGFRQIARSKVVIEKIEAAGDGERTFNGTYTLRLENKSLPLSLTTLRIAAGWITATMQ